MCVVGVCVPGGGGGEQGLVKTFTTWQVLGCWQVLDGVGGVWACGTGGCRAAKPPSPSRKAADILSLE